MQHFVWQPGGGVEAEALDRLRTNFTRPMEPMGEAWFMGEERRLFHELKGDLRQMPARELQESLEEIASGTSSFGSRPEWHSWYHYLLGQLVPRSHESFVSSLLESLITGFVALHPNGIHSKPYAQFADDVLLTLGRCMMDRHCWNDREIVVGAFLHRTNNNPNRVWCWWDASGDFSASMFFCLKYLPTSLVEEWLKSVLEIPSPHWRAQVLVWLVGSHSTLAGHSHWPSEWSIDARPSVSWEWCHCLRSELATANEGAAPPISSLVPEASRRKALRLFQSHFTEDVFLEWLSSISSVPYLEEELAEIPSTFEGMYVRAG